MGVNRPGVELVENMSASLVNFRHLGTKIVCVGRNYAKHAAEMKYTTPSEKPVVFSKTPNCFLSEGEGQIEIPHGSNNLHHEVELGVVIGKRARWVKKQEAMDYVGGYTIALDMTARDLQSQLKQAQQPWFIAKSFDTACPVGSFVDVAEVPNPHAVQISCSLNGVERQNASTAEMLFDIPTILEYVTQFVTLERGDLVLTGSPEGVGQCQSGDEVAICMEWKSGAGKQCEKSAKFSVK